MKGNSANATCAIWGHASKFYCSWRQRAISRALPLRGVTALLVDAVHPSLLAKLRVACTRPKMFASGFKLLFVSLHSTTWWSPVPRVVNRSAMLVAPFNITCKWQCLLRAQHLLPSPTGATPTSLVCAASTPCSGSCPVEVCAKCSTATAASPPPRRWWWASICAVD